MHTKTYNVFVVVESICS